MSTITHVLLETALGYALFTSSGAEEIGAQQVQDNYTDLNKLSKIVHLVTFQPFQDAAQALENANDVSEGVLNPYLQALLEQHLPSKRSQVLLGVCERGLAGAIKSALNVECDTSDRALSLVRGLRLHAEKLLPGLEINNLVQAGLGLGHAYSRAKVKFNVHRSDNMIIQAVALLDQLDKDVNLFAMRVREWYGWHFPELVKVVPDNAQYAKVVKAVGDKSKLVAIAMKGPQADEDEDPLMGQITDILGDEQRAKSVLDAARTSMGTDISPVDLINISNFADRVIQLFNYRSSLQTYLHEKMNLVAPNLGALIGDTVAARLISHAGSLTNLSKYPASTVQILGAEKALFRALKTKGNTPKYGLIYHSTFIGRAVQKNKGRISRFLANKASIASRIDCYADTPSTKFGEALRDQVEERLAFYESGSNPTKNQAVMQKVLDQLRSEEVQIDTTKDAMQVDDEQPEASSSSKKEKKDKKKKRKSEAVEDAPAEEAPEAADGDKKLKKKKSKKSLTEEPAADASTEDASSKKSKKRRKSESGAADESADVSMTAPAEGDTEKKEKKDKKKKRKSEA